MGGNGRNKEEERNKKAEESLRLKKVEGQAFAKKQAEDETLAKQALVAKLDEAEAKFEALLSEAHTVAQDKEVQAAVRVAAELSLELEFQSPSGPRFKKDTLAGRLEKGLDLRLAGCTEPVTICIPGAVPQKAVQHHHRGPSSIALNPSSPVDHHQPSSSKQIGFTKSVDVLELPPSTNTEAMVQSHEVHSVTSLHVAQVEQESKQCQLPVVKDSLMPKGRLLHGPTQVSPSKYVSRAHSKNVSPLSAHSKYVSLLPGKDGRRPRVKSRLDINNSMERLDKDVRAGEIEEKELQTLVSRNGLSAEEEEMIHLIEDSTSIEFEVDTARRKFEEWMTNFNDQERRFISPVVMCEVQYNEILEFTDGLQQPNMLRTAACSVLFDKLVHCYALKRDSLLERLKNDLMYAVYREYNPHVVASADFFNHEPYFVHSKRLEQGQKQVQEQWVIMTDKEKAQSLTKKFVKTVDSRSLEVLHVVFFRLMFHSWADLSIASQRQVQTIRNLCSIAYCSRASLMRLARRVFSDWKLITATAYLWKLNQANQYFQEVIEEVKKMHPETVAEAKKKHLVQDVDEVNVEDFLEHENSGHKDEAAAIAMSRRPLTWGEKLKVMYHDVAKTKPFTLKNCMETIADIYAAKMKNDIERDGAGEPRQPLPDFCRDFFLIHTGLGSKASKRLCELMSGVQKYCSEHPRIKTFADLMNAQHASEGWDPHSISFVLCALSNAVPDWLVLSRLFQASNLPTIGLGDAMRATEVAFASAFSLGPTPVHLIDQLRQLHADSSLTDADFAKVGGDPRVKRRCALTNSKNNRVSELSLVRADSSALDEQEKTHVILLDEWLELLLETWTEQLLQCRRTTLDLILREQRNIEHGGVVLFSKFMSLLRGAKEGISDAQILRVYNETMDLGGRQQDKIVPEHFFEVCRNHGISF